MGKRPVGLAKAAKLKKAKLEEKTASETPVVEKSVDRTPDPEKPQLEIEVPEDEEDEELAELFGLFNSFEQSGGAPKLAQGIIHECDRILRARAELESAEPLPAKFHLVYGEALLALAKLQEDKEASDPESAASFVSAAVDRLATGLEVSAEDAALKAAHARAVIERIDAAMRDTKGSKKRAKIAAKSLGELKDAMEAAAFAVALEQNARTSAAVEAVDQFAIALGALPPQPEFEEFISTVNDWALPQWEKLLTASDDAVLKKANKGLGEHYLGVAAPLLTIVEGDNDDEDDEDDDEDDDEEEEQTEEQKAASEAAQRALIQAIIHLKKAHSDDTPEAYVQTAEALISLGNLDPVDSPDQQKQYARAVKLLKKAQLLGAGSFHDLIESLEPENA